MKIRIGSFNFENYFSRAKLLAGDNAKMKPLLESAAKLEALLDKATYTAADKTKIAELLVELDAYVEIRENHGKLLQGDKVTAKGRGDWEGGVEFKRSRVPVGAQENTIRVVKAVDADILCVIEMEDRLTLKAAGSAALLKTKKYPHAMLIDGNDDRGIDVGLLSRFPITTLRSHVDDKDSTGEVFSRDCLEARVEPTGTEPITLLINHLKSQGYGSQDKNNAKRLRQAERVAEILGNYDLKKDYVVVAGDMNADRNGPNKDSLAPLLNYPDLVDIHAQQLAQGEDWAYFYANKKQRLDYLWVSTALAKKLVQVGIERRGMYNLEKISGGAEKSFPEVTRASLAASDHAAIWAEFDLS